MNPKVRRIVRWSAVVVLLAVLALAFWPKPLPVDLGAVTRGPLRVSVDEDGKTRVRERYVVSSPLAGRLQRVVLKPGDRVEEGRTVLAVLEPHEPELIDDRARAQLQARVRAAEATLKRSQPELERVKANHDLAQAELDRAERLRASGGIAAQDYETAVHRERAAREEVRSAQYAVQIAEFELEQAQAALARSRPRSPGQPDETRFEVRSPIAGAVLRVLQESATPVTPGTTLLEVGDPTDLEVEVDLLSADAVKVQPGARAILEHWGGSAPLHGQVRVVEPSAFTKISALGVEEQRVNVIIDLLDPPEKRPTLGDGYRVEARIVVWEDENALKVPAGALFRHNDGWAVFVTEGGRARLRPIRVGPNNGLEAVVLDGLEEGAAVILHPSDRVQDGTAVAPR